MAEQQNILSQLINYLGLLRALLYLAIVVVAVFSLFTGGPVAYSGWAMVTTLIVPALVPILFFVLLLDILMSAVFMSDSEGAARRRFKDILTVEVVLVVVVLAAWLPFFLSLGEP